LTRKGVFKGATVRKNPRVFKKKNQGGSGATQEGEMHGKPVQTARRRGAKNGMVGGRDMDGGHKRSKGGWWPSPGPKRTKTSRVPKRTVPTI